MGASPSTLQNFSSSLPSSVEESYDLFLANIWLCGLIVTLSAALIAFSQRKTIKKKYDLYKLSKKLFPDGEDMNTLTHLDMVGRVLKKEGEYPITKGELAHKSIPEFAKTVVDPVSPERGTSEEVDKYWPFLPGLTYDQCADGVHVQLEGDDHKCVLMSSLSYWAFHVNDEVREYAFEAVRKTGTGNHGSYLLLGKNLVVKEAYERMANFFKRKYCSFSASGFLACMNLVANLCPKGGVIFMDEKCHICLRYGGKLTGAKVISFPHQNYEALGKLMKQHRHKYKGRSLLVVDAIYSADGTIANLPAARKLCDEYDTWIVMDEAHSLGSIGATGHGIEEHFNMYGACDFICGVFSKSLSSSGGYVVSNSDIVKSLNVTPGVGFATGPHSFTAASVAKALEIIERDNGKTRAAIDKMRLFYVNELKTVAKAANIIHCGHNVFVSYPHHSAATTVSIEMRKRGYYMSSFLYPSVPLDRSILRLTLNPLMTEEILKGFCKTLGEVHELLVPRLGKEVMYGKHQKKYYDELHGGDEADEEMKTKKEKKDQ